MSILDGLVNDPDAKRNQVSEKKEKDNTKENVKATKVQVVKTDKKSPKPTKNKLDPEFTTQARLSNGCNQVLLMIKKHEKLGSINDVILMFLKQYKSGNAPLDSYIKYILNEENG